MKLTSEQVEKVAKLANIPISSDEKETYSAQLSGILDYIAQLNSADTEGVDPTFNISPGRNIWHEDKTKESLTQEEALQNAPQKRNGMFVTKGVFISE